MNIVTVTVRYYDGVNLAKTYKSEIDRPGQIYGHFI
jgi:hypothetical protein